MSNLTGLSLGRYHLLEQLGEGGMATVYKALDTRLERTVAVKVILGEREHSEKFRARFEREAKTLAGLSHPNIVKVLDSGEEEGRAYLVMEFISGGTLKPRLGQSIPYQDAARLLAPIAHALDYAHQQKVIHRDIKPSNILLTASGLPMLSDFGIAKMLEAEETLDLTGTGAGLGTPDYMAPEQGYARGVDGRADIYALGVVFYEMVAGRKPYRADTPMAVMLMKNTEPLPRPSKFVPGLPEGVERVLIKALARQPENRYQAAGEFAAALEELAQGRLPTVSRQPREKTGTGSGSRRVRWGWIAAAGAGALLICVASTIGLVSLLNKPGGTQPAAPVATRTSVTPEPSATSTPVPSPTIENRSPLDGMEMVHVPAGEFLMGVTQADQDLLFSMCPACPRDLFQDAPQRSITLDEYWIDKTEVTNGQFALFVNATGYITTAEQQGSSLVFNSTNNTIQRVSGVDWRQPQGRQIDIDQYSQYPVIQVSWEDASAYCLWAGRRLPTEAEWEKAARGTDSRLFPWGNSAPTGQLVNFNLLNQGPVPVGSYPANVSPYGAQDMAGNVWEWTSTTYGDPNRFLRCGGSWGTMEEGELALLSSAYALSNTRAYSSDLLGFRCVSDTAP